MFLRTNQVEFFGGPFDGHVHMIRSIEDHLAQLIAVPVNRNVIEWLSGNSGEEESQATSVAVYILESLPEGIRYSFQGTVPPELFQMEHWVG